MNVTARDQSTGKEQKITISASTNLSKEDVERLVREADVYSQEDLMRKEQADLHNEADSLCYAVGRLVKDLGNNLSSGEKARAEMLATDLAQKLKEGADQETVKGVMNELRGTLVILQQVAARLHAEGKGGPPPTTGGASPAAPTDDPYAQSAPTANAGAAYGGGNGGQVDPYAQAYPAAGGQSDQAELQASEQNPEEPEVTAAVGQGDESVEAEFRQTSDE